MKHVSSISYTILLLVCVIKTGESHLGPLTTAGFVSRHSGRAGAREDARRPSLSLNEKMFSQALREKLRRESPPLPRSQLDDTEDEDFLMAGGTKPKALVHERDYFRQATRLEAWDSYVLVSVLCTSISYNALQYFTIDKSHEGIFIYDHVLIWLIHLVAGSAVLSGLYSTMVFSLSILYGKTALGMERDPQFDSFMQKSAAIRVKGFRAFSATLGLFGFLVVLMLTEDLPSLGGFPLGSLMLAALLFGFKDWKSLVDNAGGIFLGD